MINWTKPMKQTYEFTLVDPNSWEDSGIIDTITTCTINRDLTNATLGSAQIDVREELEECYVRAYLIAEQENETERVALGTFLVQTPSVKFDGKNNNVSLDAYTPLIELKGTNPPVGYSRLKGDVVMDAAYDLAVENTRVPVVYNPEETDKNSAKTLYYNFTANVDDNWLSYIAGLISNVEYQLGLDEYGKIIFEPIQETAALQPVWTYTDDNSSILYPDITNERDLYNIPNVVEVIYSSSSNYLRSVVENNDANSPVSIQNRGRRVEYRDTNPSFSGEPSQKMLDEYAKKLLKNLSCLEYKVTYTHGYCPVRLGDAVILNYERAGLVNVKAKVISQSIKCQTGCAVEETAVYTEQLWG